MKRYGNIKKETKKIFLNITSSSTVIPSFVSACIPQSNTQALQQQRLRFIFPAAPPPFLYLSPASQNQGALQAMMLYQQRLRLLQRGNKNNRHHIRLITKRANETTQSWRERRLRDKIQLLRAVLPYGWAAFKQVHQKQKYMHPRLHTWAWASSTLKERVVMASVIFS